MNILRIILFFILFFIIFKAIRLILRMIRGHGEVDKSFRKSSKIRSKFKNAEEVSFTEIKDKSESDKK